MDWVEIELVDNCVVDNHHSPMKPMQYIHARLVPMLNFYQSRLSHKSVEWQTTTFFMLLATTSITILSFLSSDGRDLTGPAGVVAALMAALAAWQKDSGADRKMHRYSNSIVCIKNHMLCVRNVSFSVVTLCCGRRFLALIICRCTAGGGTA